MTIEKQRYEAEYRIDLLIEKQRIFWNSLHDIVELAGDQFVGTRLRFLELEKQEADKGGALILGIILIFGFSAFPVHSMIAGMIVRGIRKSKTIQTLIDKNVINKLMKLPKEELQKLNNTNIGEYENQTINQLNDVMGQSLKLFITQEVKNRIKEKKKNRNFSNGSEQNEGIVVVKKGLYKWIAAHSSSDIQILIKLKNDLKSDEWDEDLLDGVLKNLGILLKESINSPNRNVNEDDFQLLIEAALWSATYDFWPGFRKKNQTTLYRDPIKLPKNDEFWKYLIDRFINNGFMSRLFYGKVEQYLRKEGKYNSTKFNENVRNTDLNKMRSKYWKAPQKQVAGNSSDPNTMSIAFDPKDENKLLLTFYFDELSTALDSMQEKLANNI